jgi:hypothetical protein
MDASDAEGDTEVLAAGRFIGWSAFQQRVRWVLAAAAEQGAINLILCDPDFQSWPLGEVAAVSSLSEWAKRRGKMTMLAQSFTELPRAHPRFVSWRGRWDHLLDCRRCGPVHQGAFPSVLWTPDWVVQRFEGDRFEGVVTRDPARRFQLREVLNEVIKTSSPGFPATTLGL